MEAPVDNCLAGDNTFRISATSLDRLMEHVMS